MNMGQGPRLSPGFRPEDVVTWLLSGHKRNDKNKKKVDKNIQSLLKLHLVHLDLGRLTAAAATQTARRAEGAHETSEVKYAAKETFLA